jgi:16S rRNA processing protein RimM
VVNAEPGVLAVGVETSLGTVVRCAGTADRPIVRVEGVEDRGAAEALRGEPILAELALADDEFWAEDLVGLEVADGDRPVGVVERVLAYPSCDLLVVGELLVPLIDDAVRAVDLEAGRIDVDLGFLGAG